MSYPNKQKVLVAMSGGVDSSVAAAILIEQGFELVGITLNLYCSTGASDRSCCSAAAAHDAKLAADKLGFPHFILNFKEKFQIEVIDNFIDEYKNGRTPNPCIRCNQFIKFNHLLRKAQELGCDCVATGHYARLRREIPNPKSQILNKSQNIKYQLLKGKDDKKDQSYVLYQLGQKELARILFPLGEMTKGEVRAKAKELGLAVADKKESQEICFVEDDDYGRFLKKNVPEAFKPGSIVNKNGQKVGEHEGIAFYTIGQRKGIGAHQGQPKYVIGIDARSNTIIIGDDKDLYKHELLAENLSFVSGKTPAGTLTVTAKIRYNSKEAEASLEILGKDRARVKFKAPQRAITPGQSIVFYSGEEVLGGGIINR